MIVDWQKITDEVQSIYTKWINSEPINYWKLDKLDTLKKAESDKSDTIKSNTIQHHKKKKYDLQQTEQR